MPCTFSTCQLPKVLRQCGCFQHFDFQICFAPQPHAIVNLSSLIWRDDFAPAALASLLFDPPEPGKHWKKHGVLRCFATFFPFRAPGSSFFWRCLLSDLLSSSFLFSDSSHLCLSMCPYCRKFDFNDCWTMEEYGYGSNAQAISVPVPPTKHNTIVSSN